MFLNLIAEQVIQAIDPKKVEIIQRYSYLQHKEISPVEF